MGSGGLRCVRPVCVKTKLTFCMSVKFSVEAAHARVRCWETVNAEWLVTVTDPTPRIPVHFQLSRFCLSLFFFLKCFLFSLSNTIRRTVNLSIRSLFMIP